jgi:hypothetical protein
MHLACPDAVTGGHPAESRRTATEGKARADREGRGHGGNRSQDVPKVASEIFPPKRSGCTPRVDPRLGCEIY